MKNSNHLFMFVEGVAYQLRESAPRSTLVVWKAMPVTQRKLPRAKKT